MNWVKLVAVVVAFSIGVGLHRLGRERYRPTETKTAEEFTTQQIEQLSDKTSSLIERNGVLTQLLVDADTPSEMTQLLGAAPNGAKDFVAHLWAEADPSSYFKHSISVTGDRPDIPHLGKDLFKIWARTDPEAALRAIDEMGAINPTMWRDYTRGAYEGWLTKDPQEVLHTAPPTFLSSGASSDSSEHWGWIERDLEAGIDILVAAPYSAWRSSGLEFAGRRVAEADPAALLEKYEDIDGWARRSLVTSVVPRWTELDLAAAVNWVDLNLLDLGYDDSPQEMRRELLYDMIHQPFLDGGKGFFRLILDQFAGERIPQWVAREIALEWAEEDPTAAIKWAISRGETRVVDEVLVKQSSAFISSWIEQTLAKDLSNESLARVTIARVWDDGEEAVARAIRLPKNRRAYVLANIALISKAEALPALRENLDSVEHGPGRETLLTIMGNLYTLEDPLAGKEWRKSLSADDRKAAERNLF